MPTTTATTDAVSYRVATASADAAATIVTSRREFAAAPHRRTPPNATINARTHWSEGSMPMNASAGSAAADAIAIAAIARVHRPDRYGVRPSYATASSAAPHARFRISGVSVRSPMAR